MLGYKSNSYWDSKPTRRQEKQSGQTAAETTKEGAGRVGRLGSAMKDTNKGNAISRLQSHAKAEAERQRKKKQEEEEAKKKKAETKSTAPQKGFIERMMDKYWYKKED